MNPVLDVQRVTGGYSPRKPVLHELSFTLAPGEMIGLIGLNGAGKSTAIKHILGLMQPHTGEIRIQGTTLAEDPERYRSALAYVPETPLLFDELTVEEHLRLTGMAYGVDQARYEQLATDLLGEFYMKPKRGAFAAHLSKGMRQKVMIMNALLARPPLYIIDEPFLGLDPLGIRSLLDKLVEVKREGAAIFMSSHILSTVETYCDRFIVLHHGRMIAYGTLAEVCAAAGFREGEGSLEEAFYRLTADGGSNGTIG
ncbi:ABC-2 type transport system ATP-binding protein [Paenibacillus phyllosphaerae]|uniref:ABC-2 type transport system ATP-binding protein n=1 Tax=Paenibacillus phyllosphaerae TaxID=274593 RepID=A0A7W5B3I7_9BACL|nr:ABC transporter ATP-binding protein [Paenibacillus phyllosphaerae]MBB3113663.1 ABC-2 type transport system ATP-binding protein [Paenibacillus phyllosphaerae]